MSQTPAGRWARSGLAAVLALFAGAAPLPVGSAAEFARVIPAAAIDESAAPTSTSEVAVLAGGCFWGVQGVFQHVGGVTSAVSGYAGGAKDTAHYEIVGSGRTGHAEAVRVTFDPKRISYGRILQIYFSVVHDPTQLDRQGSDVGPQYRSAIFPQTAEQAHTAHAYIAQLRQAGVFPVDRTGQAYELSGKPMGILSGPPNSCRRGTPIAAGSPQLIAIPFNALDAEPPFTISFQLQIPDTSERLGCKTFAITFDRLR